MRSGIAGNNCSGLSVLLVVLYLISFNNKCAMLPELEAHRADKIIRGPQYAPYYGLKKRIAVLDFENSTAVGGKKLSSAVADMLIYQLVRSGRFILVERSRIDQILQEQAWGQSGAITEQTAPQVGQLMGVECLVLGRILEAKQETGSGKVADKKDEWKLKLKATVGIARIAYKIISTTTGEILLANDAAATEIKPGFDLKTKDFDLENMFDFDQTILGLTIRKAVNQMARDIIDQVDIIDWVGKVVQCKADTLLYFTPGRGAGVQLDQLFDIFPHIDVENLEDVSTEELIPSAQPTARVKVCGFIGDKVARAKVIQGGRINRGDYVKLVKSFLPKRIE